MCAAEGRVCVCAAGNPSTYTRASSPVSTPFISRDCGTKALIRVAEFKAPLLISLLRPLRKSECGTFRVCSQFTLMSAHKW